jgi:hypothetical protein
MSNSKVSQVLPTGLQITRDLLLHERLYLTSDCAIVLRSGMNCLGVMLIPTTCSLGARYPPSSALSEHDLRWAPVSFAPGRMPSRPVHGSRVRLFHSPDVPAPTHGPVSSTPSWSLNPMNTNFYFQPHRFCMHSSSVTCALSFTLSGCRRAQTLFKSNSRHTQIL